MIKLLRLKIYIRKLKEILKERGVISVIKNLFKVVDSKSDDDQWIIVHGDGHQTHRLYPNIRRFKGGEMIAHGYINIFSIDKDNSITGGFTSLQISEVKAKYNKPGPTHYYHDYALRFPYNGDVNDVNNGAEYSPIGQYDFVPKEYVKDVVTLCNKILSSCSKELILEHQCRYPDGYPNKDVRMNNIVIPVYLYPYIQVGLCCYSVHADDNNVCISYCYKWNNKHKGFSKSNELVLMRVNRYSLPPMAFVHLGCIMGYYDAINIHNDACKALGVETDMFTDN